jgi:hypothetical protein
MKKIVANEFAIGVLWLRRLELPMREERLEAAVREGFGRVLRPGVLSLWLRRSWNAGRLSPVRRQLEDYSRKNIDAEIAALKSFREAH